MCLRHAAVLAHDATVTAAGWREAAGADAAVPVPLGRDEWLEQAIEAVAAAIPPAGGEGSTCTATRAVASV